MELIDADGRRWRVTAIRRTGRTGSLLDFIIGFGPPQSRIEQDLEPLPSLSLAEVRARMQQSIRKFRVDYGEDAEFNALLDEVERAGSIAEIYDVAQPDTFESY